MLETKINLIITSFAIISFSITAFYYIFGDIVKNVRKNKTIKAREIKLKEKLFRERNEILPPSIFKINDLTIDLDSVIGLSFESEQHIIRFMTATNGCNYIISINDLNFIENTEELGFNSEYKVITDEFSYPYYNTSSPETKFSKNAEIEKLYNQLLKWKALRKLYLTAGIKASIHDYSFYSLIKDIKFIDLERDVCNKLYQQNYIIRINSTYGISNLDNKQKEKKNEKLVYVEDQPI
jgi:hypothetical protein